MILDQIVYGIGMIFLSIGVHELGHAAYFKYAIKRKVKIYIKTFPLRIQTGKLKDYVGLKKEQLAGLAFAGMVAGAIPILLISDLYVKIPVGIFYILGLRKDFYILVRNTEFEA